VTQAAPPAQNRLEEVLEQAAGGDADARARLPNVLLNGDLYVVGRVEGAVDRVDGNYATVGDASQLEIPTARLGDETVVAAFTSPARVEAATGGKLPYLGLRGRDLLARRPRALKVVLNPGVWHGKELLPDEIERMLDGGVATVPAGSSVMLGRAAERPDALVEQLHGWLATRPDVVGARLGQIFDERSGQPPHPLVGLELADGAQLESVFASAPDFEEPVDLVPLAGHPLGAWLEANGEEVYRR
jgi:SseB protein N-terminal domain/SseB protein C-terminal domain